MLSERDNKPNSSCDVAKLYLSRPTAECRPASHGPTGITLYRKTNMCPCNAAVTPLNLRLMNGTHKQNPIHLYISYQGASPSSMKCTYSVVGSASPHSVCCIKTNDFDYLTSLMSHTDLLYFTTTPHIIYRMHHPSSLVLFVMMVAAELKCITDVPGQDVGYTLE